jgi:hypothetical protein
VQGARHPPRAGLVASAGGHARVGSPPERSSPARKPDFGSSVLCEWAPYPGKGAWSPTRRWAHVVRALACTLCSRLATPRQGTRCSGAPVAPYSSRKWELQDPRGALECRPLASLPPRGEGMHQPGFTPFCLSRPGSRGALSQGLSCHSLSPLGRWPLSLRVEKWRSFPRVRGWVALGSSLEGLDAPLR